MTTVTIDHNRIANLKAKGNKQIGQCPACAAAGQDKSGEHLVVYGTGQFGCIAFPGDGADAKQHRRQILDLIGCEEEREYRPPHRPNDAKISKPAAPVVKGPEPTDWARVATYEYQDANGRPRFYVDRIESRESGKKKFAQYVKRDGERVNSLDGVDRVLFRLPEVLREQTVYICEGEKCVLALEAVSLCATTNPGGASGWLDAYADSLLGKDIVLFPDQDDAGAKWTERVMESLRGRVESVRIVNVPEPHNDIADWVATFEELFQAFGAIEALVNAAPRLPKGYEAPCESVPEAFERYRKDMIERQTGAIVSVAAWLPSLGKSVRPLFKGDMVMILADTGVGKTAIVTNLTIAIPRPTVVFQLEIANEQLAERYGSATLRMASHHVEQHAVSGGSVDFSALKHVQLCKRRGLTVQDIAETIRRMALIFGRPVEVAYVDYLGLVKGAGGGGGKRYERVSSVAEDLKTVAAETGVVMICTSQVSRPEDGEIATPSLHSARDSGAIENSSQLVLGVWPEEQNDGGAILLLKILKNTKGRAGDLIRIDYDARMMTMKEIPQ